MEIGPETTPDRLLEVAHNLARRFAPRAAEYDRQGKFPKDNFNDLRDAGFLGILVPREHGGAGASFLTYTRALERLAMGDASTALAFNMHNLAVGPLTDPRLAELPDRRGQSVRDFCAWVFKECVAGRKLFATAASEPGIGYRLSRIHTRYKRVEGGFTVNGVKSFVSIGSHADYCVVAARSERDAGDVPGISFLVIERGSPGVRIDDAWDTLGMRATCSNTMHLEDCFVPSDRLYLLEAMALYKSAREAHWHVGSCNGVYLGIASAVLEFVTGYLGGRAKAGTQEPLADDAMIQHRIGKMCTDLEAARSVVYEAARMADEAPGSLETNVAIHRAKYMVSVAACDISADAIRVCGGGAIFKSRPLERYYRDAICCSVMPASNDDCLTYVGKAQLGIDVMSPRGSYW
jgi:alkylation response protein AidB-like acyl-CoA dehydrogenase